MTAKMLWQSNGMPKKQLLEKVVHSLHHWKPTINRFMITHQDKIPEFSYAAAYYS